MNYSSSLCPLAGKSASIHYGTGAISGYFSQDCVKIGDVVVKNQVCNSQHIHLFYVIWSCTSFLRKRWVLLGYFARILLKLRGSQVLLSWLQNSMAFLGLDSRKSQLEMLYLCGEQVHICNV